MRFSGYCQENSIETFVDSMTDFAELVKISSPEMGKFAATCLNQTVGTRAIQRVLWSEVANEQKKVSFAGKSFGSSYISPIEAQENTRRRLNKNVGLHNFTIKKWLNLYGIGQNNSYLRDVEVFLIRCDWMTRSADGKNDQRDKEEYTDALSAATTGIKKSDLYEVLVKYGWT